MFDLLFKSFGYWGMSFQFCSKVLCFVQLPNVCKQFYLLDDTIKPDKCDIKGTCGHICISTIEDYYCLCKTNYHLFADKKTCLPGNVHSCTIMRKTTKK